jgi:hypothetical protein
LKLKFSQFGGARLLTSRFEMCSIGSRGLSPHRIRACKSAVKI